jgi:hypothetical protein
MEAKGSLPACIACPDMSHNYPVHSPALHFLKIHFNIILPPTDRSAWLHNIFAHYLINGTTFGKKGPQHKKCVLYSLKVLFEIFIILSRMEQDMIINLK